MHIPGRVTSIELLLSEEECYQNVRGLYDFIAKGLGFEIENITNYDCSKISVTKSVQEKMFSFYKEEMGFDDGLLGVLWVMLGPTADLPQNDYRAVITRGFITCST